MTVTVSHKPKAPGETLCFGNLKSVLWADEENFWPRKTKPRASIHSRTQEPGACSVAKREVTAQQSTPRWEYASGLIQEFGGGLLLLIACLFYSGAKTKRISDSSIQPNQVNIWGPSLSKAAGTGLPCGLPDFTNKNTFHFAAILQHPSKTKDFHNIGRLMPISGLMTFWIIHQVFFQHHDNTLLYSLQSLINPFNNIYWAPTTIPGTWDTLVSTEDKDLCSCGVYLPACGRQMIYNHPNE